MLPSNQFVVNQSLSHYKPKLPKMKPGKFLKRQKRDKGFIFLSRSSASWEAMHTLPYDKAKITNLVRIVCIKH